MPCIRRTRGSERNPAPFVNSIKLVFILVCILFSSCRSINRSPARLRLPPSLVILSFDDGPNVRGNSTARLLDLLKEKQITAMFALLGINAEHNPELVRRIHAEGHYIINHGYSDKWAFRMRKSEFRENLLKGEAAITAALGRELPYKLYRPQGGYYRASQKRIWRKAGYTLVPGSVRAYDAVMTEYNRAQVIRRVVTKTEKDRGGIVLLHDARDSFERADAYLEDNPNGVFDRSWIPGTVEEIISVLSEDGYSFAEARPGDWGLLFD